MLKTVVLRVFAITLISGVAITTIPLENPSPKLITGKETAATPASANITLAPELSTPEESEVDPDLNVDPETFSIGKIHTVHGVFVQVDKQTIFNESEIAVKLNQIGPYTKQLTLNVGIFLKEDS